MSDHLDRRLLLKLGGATAGLVLGGRSADAQRLPPPSAVNRGRVESGRVTFPEWRGEADPKTAPPPAPLPPDKRVGFAVVALGRLSMEELLPEGLQDHVIMEAIYESARTGRPVKLKAYEGRDVFRGPMPPGEG